MKIIDHSPRRCPVNVLSLLTNKEHLKNFELLCSIEVPDVQEPIAIGCDPFVASLLMAGCTEAS